MQERLQDICAFRDAMYLGQRAEHVTRVNGPDGKTHEVDMLRMLCLSEMFEYGLCSAKVRNHPGGAPGVFATQDISAGHIITFFPGDHVAFAPTPGGKAQLRLSSDRARGKPLKDIEGAYAYAVDANFTMQGDPECVDNPNYLAHVIRKGQSDMPANCTLVTMHGIAVAATATRDIVAEEEVLVAACE